MLECSATLPTSRSMFRMKIIHAANELKPGGRKVCLAIGFFDGVHLGHQQIIRQTIADARQHDAIALVLTFDRHPNSVVAPGPRAAVDLFPAAKTARDRIARRGRAAADSFRQKFQRTNRRSFHPRAGARPGKIHSICVGADFVFGHKRSGNVALLKKLGGETRFSRSRTGRRFARRPNCQQHAHPRSDPRRRSGRRQPDAGPALCDFRPRGRRRPAGPATRFSDGES